MIDEEKGGDSNRETLQIAPKPLTIKAILAESINFAANLSPNAENDNDNDDEDDINADDYNAYNNDDNNNDDYNYDHDDYNDVDNDYNDDDVDTDDDDILHYLRFLNPFT